MAGVMLRGHELQQEVGRGSFSSPSPVHGWVEMSQVALNVTTSSRAASIPLGTGEP